MARDRLRHRSDSAGVGPDPKYADDLVSISDLKEYRIGSGQADIRGWDVRTLAGRKVGDVDDLLVDTRRGEVVLIDVDLKDTDRHAEVPIRNVQIDRERKCVVVDSADLGVFEGDLSEGRREPYRTDDRYRERSEAERITTDREPGAFDQTADRTTDRVPDERLMPETRVGTTREGEEIVVERRPLVEEVVVRRKPADEER